MKLILKENVANLGEAGEVVQVKPGYGRNYLVPQGLAYEASQANIEMLEEEQRKREEKKRRDFLEAGRRASQLVGVSLNFLENASDEGKLFGSVTAADITDQINRQDIDFELDRKTVQLDDPIKEVGTLGVIVRLHPEVEVEIEVNVQPQEG